MLLDKQKVTGRLAGRVPDLKRWLPDAEGAAGFDISANGPLNASAVRAVINSADARLVGRRLQDLSFIFEGTADPNAPKGKLTGTGSLDGQAIRVNADIAQTQGRTSAPAINAEIGPNKLSGALNFSPAFLPEGQLTFDFRMSDFWRHSLPSRRRVICAALWCSATPVVAPARRSRLPALC